MVFVGAEPGIDNELFFSRNVGDPARIIVPLFRSRVLPIAFATFFIRALPVNGGLAESSLLQNFPYFWQGPQSPVVGEGLLHLRAVTELEVDVAEHVTIDGIVFLLMPVVGEIVVFGFFLDGFVGFITAIGVKKKHAILA